MKSKFFSNILSMILGMELEEKEEQDENHLESILVKTRRQKVLIAI